jgi:CHAT domain-containing protein
VVNYAEDFSYLVLVEGRPAPGDAAEGLAILTLPGGNAIDELVAALVEPSILDLTSRARTLGAEGFEMLLGPVRDRIRGKNLVIVPGGPLSLLPFELLVRRDNPGDEGVYLVEEHRVRYAPSLTVLHLTRQWDEKRTAPDRSLWAMGDPVYEPEDERLTGRPAPPFATVSRDAIREVGQRERGEPDGLRFPRLVYSGDEVRAISRLLAAPAESILLGLDATEANVKKASADGVLARARYIHFATHGILGIDRGQQPALVLCPFGDGSSSGAGAGGGGGSVSTGVEDGFLRLDEVTQLRLNADLVVLSACRSGRGQLQNGEGVRGLSRAFLYAGSRAVLCSLWQVSDHETSTLMTELYSNLKAGQPAHVALHSAQLRMIADGRPPLFWAPFVVVGQ